MERTSHSRRAPATASPDVVGIGALNVDYIASASGLSQRTAERVTESVARFEWNREGPVAERAITEAMRTLGAASLGSSLGGSAWLTVFALGQMKVGVRLGYVGAVGRVEAPGLSFTGQMEELGIDDRWVARIPDRTCGICLSYIDDADRVMLTYPGANTAMSDHIRRNFDDLAAYLAGARFLHVTSFLDDRTPRELLRLLARAKELNPRVILSFDPGFDWADHPSAPVEGILALADLLFVNYREFKALGRYLPGEADDAVARKVLGRCRPEAAVFVTKRYDFIRVFRATAGGLLDQRFQLKRPVRETELEDATGAGDVFVGAVLAALTSRRLQVELGAAVGLSLARHRKRGGRPAIPDLSRGFLQLSEAFTRPDRVPAAVLIVHDGGPDRGQVRQFVERHCGLAAIELSLAALRTADLPTVMREHLPRCGFAVCVMRAAGTGDSAADQRIVHQAGILQGWYGFRRVAILAEENCGTFSNIAGLIRMDFPAGHIDSTFIELERMLRREGVLRGRGGRFVRHG